MRYAVYFTWADGEKDTFNCDDRAERDLNINAMKKSDDYKEISYCKIYKNGEYGEDKVVK